ncbi:MAG: ABC transporter permease, partial [Candidatus Thermoplasmatota archaeon]|nr:ABC transporter permease [Candidatus Thermoplasmatota archaeon]
ALTSLSYTQFSGVWTDNFSIHHTDSSGQVSEYAVNFSISRLDDAPITPNPLSSPSPNKEDEWYAIEIPDNSHAGANLSVPSGSDYNLFLYGEMGNDIDSSRQDNGCPDFYSYGPLTVLGYEVISEDDLLCPMGTTHTGSDMMSKILYGSRKSLRVGFVVAFTTCFLGLVIGGVSGYFGRWVDEVIMRVADVFFAVPGLILAMAVVAAMNDVNDLGAIGMPDVKLDRLEKIMIALVFTGWPGYSRLIRGQVLYVKEHTYIEAARSVGSGHFRILFRHVLPNAWAPMLVAVSLDIGGTILTAAGLSFIGLGADALSAEWGKMISDGRSFFPEHWWMVTFPGLAILITTLGFNLLGDGLRDVFDPKQRRSKT